MPFIIANKAFEKVASYGLVPNMKLYLTSDYKISVAKGESHTPSASYPIAMMEFYMKKVVQEGKKRQPKHSKDEMPHPTSLQGPGKRGHHMGAYIPQEELEKFMAKEAAERAKI